MAKDTKLVLSKAKVTKFNKTASIDEEFKKNNLTKEEKMELKSYKIIKSLKKQKYVRN